MHFSDLGIFVFFDYTHVEGTEFQEEKLNFPCEIQTMKKTLIIMLIKLLLKKKVITFLSRVLKRGLA